ncbi:MAG: hypothetical protein IJO48_01010 [Clostridia bacterium]|nr:hypothetical protein [Clostridia bacterium]
MEKIKKKTRKWPWVVLAVLVVLLIIMVASCNEAANKLKETVYTDYTVVKGDVSSTITGSGKLMAADSEEIDLPDGVVFEKIVAKVGDSVEEGSILAEIDMESLEYCAAVLSNEIASLDMQLASKSTQSSVVAPVKGRVKYIAVSEGDDVVEAVNEHGMLAIISADGLMRLEIETLEQVETGMTVTVKWADGSEDGKVASKTANGCVITFDDEKAEYKADAEVFSGDTLLGKGSIDVNSPVYVYGTGGTVDDIHCDVNDRVSAYEKLFSVEGGPVSAAYTQALYSRNQKAEELKKVIEYLNSPVVVSPVKGVVSQINAVEDGAAAVDGSAYAMQDTMASGADFVINTGGATKMTIEVDELDIALVKMAQKAIITLDAYSQESFTAEVTHISKLGTTTGSITNYSVELTMEYDERLLEGMNGSAIIEAESAQNVLLIPVAAIYEDENGAYVYVGTSGDDRERTDITTGVSDGSYAQVTGGLAEGDVIIYEDSSVFDMMFPFAAGMQGGAMRGGEK